MEIFGSPVQQNKTVRRGRPPKASLKASANDLNESIDDGFRTPLKRVSNTTSRKSRGRPPKSSLNSIIDFNESFDDGIGLSADDSNNDALNNSIADRIKTRTNRRKANNNMFNSKYLYDRVIESIYSKYCDSDDENVDKLMKMDKPGKPRRKRNNAVMSARTANEDSDEEVIPNIRRKTAIKTETKSKKLTTTISVASNSKANQNANSKQLQRNKDLDTISSVTTNQSTSADNELVVKYENRKVWLDTEFQSSCLEATIEMLSKRDASAFLLQINLKKLAMQSLGLPMLPNADNCFPIIVFNSKGEPKFEFYFQCHDSPVHITERFKGYDHALFELNKIAYQMISEDIVYDANQIDSQSISVEDARKRITF